MSLLGRTEDVDEIGIMAAPNRRSILGPIFASTAFVLELTLVPLLLPIIQQHFGLSLRELAWVFNSYGLSVAIGVLLGGWFGDTFGTRTVFNVGAVSFAVGSFLVATAGNFEALIVGRALQGLGGGIFSPLIPLLLTRATPHRPGWVLIVWGSVTGYVAAIAPLVYGRLHGGTGWEMAFWFLGLLTVGAAFILGSSRATEKSEHVPVMHTDYSALMRSRNLWLMFCYIFCTYGAITFYLFRLPIWLTSNDFSAVSIGFVVSTIWLSFAIVGTLLRNKVDKPLVRKIMLAAPGLIAVGLPLSIYGETLPTLALASVLVGSGLACSNAPSTQMVLRFAPKGMSALSASLDISFARLGGVATVTILASSELAFAMPAIFLLCLVAFLTALIAIRRDPPAYSG